MREKLTPLFTFQQRYPAPVFVGEFSAARWADDGEQYIRDLTSLFEQFKWSWTYFSATGWHGWNPDYNQHYPGKGNYWDKDYVGEKSARWQTLRKVFGVTQGISKQ